MIGKLAATAGIAGVAVYLVAILVVAAPPRPDAPVSQVVSYYTAHRHAYLLQSLALSVAVLLLIPFLGALFSALDGPEDGRRPLAVASLVAFVLIVAVTFIGTLPMTAVVWRGPESVPSSEVADAFAINNLSLYALSATLAAATVLMPAAVILAFRPLSRIVCLIGAASVILNAVELAGITSHNGWDAAGFGSGVGLFLWLAWVGSLCVAMLLHRNPGGVWQTNGGATEAGAATGAVL